MSLFWNETWSDNVLYSDENVSANDYSAPKSGLEPSFPVHEVKVKSRLERRAFNVMLVLFISFGAKWWD